MVLFDVPKLQSAGLNKTTPSPTQSVVHKTAE